MRSPKYEFELMEEQPIKTILTTLHATDADSTISEYQLIDDGLDDNGSKYFEINNVTGKQNSDMNSLSMFYLFVLAFIFLRFI